NRLLMHGDRHYDYDAYGNLIRERRGTAQKLVSEYRYDCQHRLIGVTRPDGRGASYRYDAFGRRSAKTVDGQTTEFFWQGDQLIAERGSSHYRSYLYEPGSFRPLALLDGEGPRNACPFYYQLDHLGTPQELTAYSGEIVWSAQYHAYGQLARLKQDREEQLEQPLRFQGQYFDAESGLHYNRHRYYTPDNGRYLTPDPSKLAGGLNGYQYTPNPTGWVDPLGLNTCPGADGCKPALGAEDPAAKARVDEGEPSLPKVTAEQRRARIEVLKEEVAKRWVERLEEKYGMHTIGKHGVEVPDAVIRQRAIDGTDPITKIPHKEKRGNLSSQYKSWNLHMHTLNDDMTRVVRGLPQFTGKDVNGYWVVRRENESVGRGYKPNKKDKENPLFIEDMHGSETK